MGKKAIVGGLIAGGLGYLASELGGDLITIAVFPYNHLSRQMLYNTIKMVVTAGLAWGVYQGIRETEKETEKHEKRVKADEILKEKILKEVYDKTTIKIEKKGEEYKIGDVSGKTTEETLSKHFMKLTGGERRIGPIPGREDKDSYMADFLSGKLLKYKNFISEKSELLDEPPLVRAAFFNRDVLSRKVDIEEVRKKILTQNEAKKKPKETEITYVS